MCSIDFDYHTYFDKSIYFIIIFLLELPYSFKNYTLYVLLFSAIFFES